MPLATFPNYRTGIDISFAGTNGVNWMVEPLYWDSVIEARTVIYIRSATEFTFSHNAQNRYYTNRQTAAIIGVNGLDGTPASGDEGIIRYRVDGQFSYGAGAPEFAARGAGSAVHQAATGPLTFASMVYTDALSGGGAVLGRVGNNGGAVATRLSYFQYGLLDPAGNECHVLTVADDSKAIPGVYKEAANWADDGRLFMFVVDPVTPVVQFRSTGGQFYTTPWTTYDVPKIHAQVTVFSGAIECELKALTGENVFYRINGGSWIEHANPILTDASFANGDNTLEYYYAGNTAFKAARVVRKNPSFPSASETHGFLYCLSPENWTIMQARIVDPNYSWGWNNRVTRQDGARASFDTVRRLGRRHVAGGMLSNAICAKYYGNDAMPTRDGVARTFAAYAKEQLLESVGVFDIVRPTQGLSDGDPNPSREIYYRGYWDFSCFVETAFAYDALIAQYRSDQHANGITPVEDYYLRDLLARGVMEALYRMVGTTSSSQPENGSGMWDVPIKIAGLITALAMPAYSTPYFGTSGMDGNTTVYTFTPFPDYPLTWKQVFFEDTTMRPFPNMGGRLGLDCSTTHPSIADAGNWRPDGKFNDKYDYVGHTSASFTLAMLLCKQFYPAKSFPFAEFGYRLAAQGQLYGTKGASTPARFIHPFLINSTFSAIADIAKPYVDAEPANGQFSVGSMSNGRFLGMIAYYDAYYLSGTAPVTQAPSFLTQPVSATVTEGQSVTFTVSISGNPTPTRQWRKNGTNISGQTGTSYTIASTVVGDAGIYDCVATNSVAPGGVKSAAATLVVNAIPPTPDPVTKRTNYKTPATVIFVT